jgi:hypothetical protein
MSIRDFVYTPSDRLLPDPEPRPAEYTIISVDDHLVEPPWLFEGRLPKKFQADAAEDRRDARGTSAVAFRRQGVRANGLQRARRPGRPR